MDYPTHPAQNCRVITIPAARALWAVRVLDAWRDSGPVIQCWGKPLKRSRLIRFYDDAAGRLLLATIAVSCTAGAPGGQPGDTVSAPEESVFFQGDTDHAARIAAAEAVWPELPESVRKELGEKP